MRGDDVDTDRIIPARHLRSVTFEGLEEYLFQDERAGSAAGDRSGATHPFDDRRYAGASIVLVNRNFGCGSSREHAVWGLRDAGFEAVVAPSFGDIFRTNCLKTGLLPVVLPEDEVRALMDLGSGAELAVDVEEQTIDSFRFELDPYERQRLLEGLDDIALTLKREDEITAFEAAHPSPVSTAAL